MLPAILSKLHMAAMASLRFLHLIVPDGWARISLTHSLEPHKHAMWSAVSPPLSATLTAAHPRSKKSLVVEGWPLTIRTCPHERGCIVKRSHINISPTIQQKLSNVTLPTTTNPMTKSCSYSQNHHPSNLTLAVASLRHFLAYIDSAITSSILCQTQKGH